MSKKFLSETQVRRFQGLAGIPALGEMYHGERHDEEEDVDMGMAPEEPELPGDEGPEDELDLDASDEGGELDLSPEEKEGLAADIVRAVAQELESALDLEAPIDVEVEDDVGGLDDLESDMDMDMAPDEEELGVDMAPEEDADMMEEEGAFAPNHYCLHHGGVQHEGKTHMAEAVGHNWSKKEQRVTHYDMKLSDGTVLESVAFEDIQVTSASLAEGHGGHMAKRSDKDKDPEKELAEIVDDETVVNEVLRRVVERLSNKK
jgi:hypothetical protein